MVKKLNKENFEETINNEKVLVDFNADWCGPCKMLAPIIEEISESEDIIVGSVNVDDEEEIAKQYGIMSIPCLILFENGKEVKKTVGFMPKSEVEKFIK